MRPVGLTSVTFRQLTVDQIITLARETGCTGIEWGSDVHVPQMRLDQTGQSCGSLPSKPTGDVLLWQLLQTESRS